MPFLHLRLLRNASVTVLDREAELRLRKLRLGGSDKIRKGF